MRAEAPFENRARVNARRGVSLEINNVPFKLVRARAEEMVETDLVQCGRRSVGGDVPANVVFDSIRAHHHGQRVPANQALDAPLQFLIAGKQRLQAHGNGVGIRRIRAKGQVDAADGGVGAKPLEDLRGHFWAAGFDNGIQRLQPLLNLDVFNAMRMRR